VARVCTYRRVNSYQSHSRTHREMTDRQSQSIDRKVSIAPMMDWTECANTAFENSGLRGQGNHGSFLVAPAFAHPTIACPGRQLGLEAVSRGRVRSFLKTRDSLTT
jgi:hypothetical protein